MAADAHAERRAKILEESLTEDWKGASWGYFGTCGPLCIGDNSMAPQSVRKVVENEDGEPIRNIQAATLKKGSTPDVYFNFETPLALGDPYIDPSQRLKKERVQQIDPDASFKPAGKIKQSSNTLGYEYVEHCDTAKDPKAVYEKFKEYTPLSNMKTNPPKKGGGGVFTPGVLFGLSEERYFPEYVPDDYDSAKQARRKELEEHLSKVQETAFKPACANGGCFQPDMEAYHCEQPVGIPRDPIENNLKPYPHEAAFRPSHPSKKATAMGFPDKEGNILKFPEWIPEPVAGGAQRKEPVEGPPAWKPCVPDKMTPATRSVNMMPRNMRAARPSSFARPKLG